MGVENGGRLTTCSVAKARPALAFKDGRSEVVVENGGGAGIAGVGEYRSSVQGKGIVGVADEGEACRALILKQSEAAVGVDDVGAESAVALGRVDRGAGAVGKSQRTVERLSKNRRGRKQQKLNAAPGDCQLAR